jgi:flagellar hook-length control protein FliK
MDIGLLISTFVADAGVNSVLPASPAGRSADRFAAKTPGIITTDNTLANDRPEPIVSPTHPRDFSHTLRKQVTAEDTAVRSPESQACPCKSQAGVKTKNSESKIQDEPAFGGSTLPEPVRDLLAKVVPAFGGLTLPEPVRDLLAKVVPAKAISVKPKTLQESAQLLTKLIGNKILLGSNQTRPGLKTVLLGISGGSTLAKTSNAEIKNGNQVTMATAKALAAPQSGKESVSKALTTDSEATAAVGKMTTAGSTLASGAAKASLLSGKAIPTGEKSAMADRVEVQSSTPHQKSDLLHSVFGAGQTSKAIPVSPGKSTPVAERQGTRGEQRGTTDVHRPSSIVHPESRSGTSGESILKHLNHPEGIQVSANQTKNKGGSQGRATADESRETTDVHHPSSSALTSRTTPLGRTSPGDVSAGIKEQVQEFISSSLSNPQSAAGGGSQRLTIHLNPPELGRVSIKFQEQAGQITGLMEVSKAQTRYEIEQALPGIIRNLADSGVQIKRLEVVLTESAAGGEHPAFGGASGRSAEGGGNPALQGNNPASVEINEWLADVNPPEAGLGFTQPHLQSAAGGSINMLI